MGRLYFSASIVFFSLTLIILSSCRRSAELDFNEYVFCDLELLSEDSSLFIANTHPEKRITGVEKLSKKEAFSGNNSIMLKKGRQYGLNCMILNTNSDEYYEVSVWRKGAEGLGSLVVSDEHSAIYYNSVNIADSSGKDGWERLRLTFYIPPDFRNVTLKFYVWNPGEEAVYFDDLRIVRKHHERYPEYSDISDLKLIVDTMESIKLFRKREEAFKKGILESADDDWIEGMMFYDEDLYKVEMRLKGDWLDHLLGRKWSFRIEMKKGTSWKGMRTFSIQNPRSRDFLNEWLMHKFCNKEDILCTRYGFIPVRYNNRNLGIYAWEEHFEKYLVESSNRREGPILKVNENALWKTQQLAISNDRKYWLPIISSAEILPFKIKRTTRDESLFGQYLIAQELYQQYKFALSKPSDVFDIDKLARYMAMIDLFGTYHGITWHNQRFYYNPVISKLEPIAFDNFSEEGAVKYINNHILGNYYIGKDKANDAEILLTELFRDSIFTDSYVHYLEKYSNADFIADFLSEYADEAKYYDSLIRREYPAHPYDPGFLQLNAKAIREELPAFREKINHAPYDKPSYSNESPDYAKDVEASVSSYFIKAYTEALNEQVREIKVENHFTRDIIILGTAKKQKRIRNFLHPEVSVHSIVGRDPGSKIVQSDSIAQYLYYMVDGDMETFSVPIYPWPKPGNRITPLQEMLDSQSENYKEIFTRGEEPNELILKAGTYEISKAVIIPEGFRVIFHPGAVINLVKKAPFISYSPIFARGTADNPVTIKSSDGTGNGFTVLQADERSSLEHITFDRLNTLDIDGWTLTGAVTFYESDVDFYQATFQNNLCEDGLNIIRSEFTIDQCTVLNTYADALDVDFGVGTISNTTFSYLSNDAIDVSGSDVNIIDCLISQSNDKGISGGENSRVTALNTSIVGSEIGIASKDQSSLIINDCSIKDCNYGLIVFKKKPEFGPASIRTNGLQMQNISIPYLVEEGSSCEVDGVLIPADKQNVYDIFYK